MKSFIISLVVFVCVTAFVFCSSRYVRRSCDELLEQAQSVQVDTNLADLSSRWENERVRFRAIVGHTETDPADTAMDDMRSRADSGDSAEFEAAKARFLAAVEAIRACETFSWDSVF